VEVFFKAEDGGSMFLKNVGIYLQVHTALQPKGPTLKLEYLRNVVLRQLFGQPLHAGSQMTLG
jgi:hypothetical protein